MKLIFIFIIILYYVIYGVFSEKVEIVIELNNQNKSRNESIEYIKQQYGFKYKGELLSQFLVFEKQIYDRTKRSVDDKMMDLERDSLVKWHQVQKPLIRRKRSIFDDFKSSFNELLFGSDTEQLEIVTTSECRESKYSFNDPFWPFQWYMNDGCEEGRNLNVTSAWDFDFTGRGVVISIIDDGVETTNPDLRDNYDSNASIDFNDGDNDPQPRYEVKNENKHGTRCAGEISASANNSVCGVGIAYNSRIGGIRLLDGRINDRIEAEALTFNIGYIDIFSASWGPLDNGKTLEGPGKLTAIAFKKGVTEGRQGRGVIYVWASGNGGRLYDNCNCDGYTASIYTITISSVTKQHIVPVYSEKCASILATTYSSDVNSNNIVTSDIRNKCTKSHTGTSASAPIAAGIIALALEANRNLTWRDVQYLIIYTSDNSKLESRNWGVNGVGRRFNHEFGFGLMNAGLMVELARQWKNVPEQLVCNINVGIDKIVKIDAQQERLITVKIESTSLLCFKTINHLEHVISSLTIENSYRGSLRISLTSPQGTESRLLDYRKNDKSDHGFKNWPFMSVHYWGENPIGEWTLKIKNSNKFSAAYLSKWNLVLHGIDRM